MSQLEVSDSGEKVVVTISKSLFKEAGLKIPVIPAARREGDALVVTLRQMDGEERAWREFFEKMDARGIKMSDEEIEAEIQAYRKEKRMAQLSDAEKG